ncbi:MAG: hypothetical protein ACOCRC_00070 [Halodesulfurarchaeum sp.]
MQRRRFLIGSAGALAALSGCSAPAAEPQPAHWVTVYLGEREETHDVTVTVTDGDGDALFERNYQLSDANEADEHAPFPESGEPETIEVTVDGLTFERDWPGFEQPELPCEEPNWAGVELWIENGADGEPTLEVRADCQHVTMAS